MTRSHRHLLITWIALLLLGGLEFGGSFIHFDAAYKPMLLLPALGMVALVALVFMEVRGGPGLSRSFAIAGLCWLTVLLGLGMIDPLTRAVYAVAG